MTIFDRTRIDRLYHSKSSDSNSHSNGTNWDPALAYLFTGKAASDHLPLLAAFETPSYNPNRIYDQPIDAEIIREVGAIRVVELLLRRAKENAEAGGDLADEWASAKAHIATFL